MGRDLAEIARRCDRDGLPPRPPGMHRVLAGRGFRAFDCVCARDTHSAPSIGIYPHARVGIELGGTFHVRSSLGDALVTPSALLLGNPGGAYEFRHVDDGGDRSLVFEYDAAFLAEIAPGGFRRTSVPGGASAARVVAIAFAGLRDDDPDSLEEAALEVAGVALAAEAPRDTAGRSLADAARVARAVRHIAAHSADDCSLATLATHARLTRYHFLRVFTALTGHTPRQHVIAQRLRRAAVALRATRAPVTDIAFAVGFGDLSHFTRSFTRSFGVSPRRWRGQR